MVRIPDEHKAHISENFKRLTDRVRLLYFTQEFECTFCKDTRELLEDIAALSDKIRLEIYDFVKDSEMVKRYEVDKIPAIVVLGEEKDYGVRFFGIPAGYEFGSIVSAIIDVSTKSTRLAPVTKELLKEVKESVHIQVFVSVTCPYCPTMVRQAHQFALENSFIKADMVEMAEFPHLAQKYSVTSVPKTVINEKIVILGLVPENIFLENLLAAITKPQNTSYIG